MSADMVIFYQNNHSVIYAVGSRIHLAKKDLEKLGFSAMLLS
jgi:hypothetical protein